MSKDTPPTTELVAQAPVAGKAPGESSARTKKSAVVLAPTTSRRRIACYLLAAVALLVGTVGVSTVAALTVIA